MSNANSSNRMLHILRNPYGFSETQVRDARLWAGDRIEKLERIIKEAGLEEQANPTSNSTATYRKCSHG